MTKMKLYEDSRAPNPRRVRIFLAEKGIAIDEELERVDVDIMSSAHKSAELTKLNSFSRIPFLVLEDGQVIAESVAICRYFEELYPQNPLFGITPIEKAKIEMWNRRAEMGLLLTIANAFRHSNPYMAELEKPQIAEWSKANLDRIGGMLDKFDEAAKANEFIAGNTYSIADITALVAIDFMRILRMKVTDDHPHLLAWYKKVKARDGSVK